MRKMFIEFTLNFSKKNGEMF